MFLKLLKRIQNQFSTSDMKYSEIVAFYVRQNFPDVDACNLDSILEREKITVVEQNINMKTLFFKKIFDICCLQNYNIVINNSFNEKNKRWIIACCLGNYFLGYETFIPESQESLIGNGKDKLRSYNVYLFALELMLPKKKIHQYVSEFKTVSELSNIFNVPEHIVIRRLKNLSLI